MVDQASEISSPQMERKDNTNDGIWSMGKKGNPVRITVVERFNAFEANEAHIFVRDASLFGLQSNRQKRKIVYIVYA